MMIADSVSLWNLHDEVWWAGEAAQAECECAGALFNRRLRIEFTKEEIEACIVGMVKYILLQGGENSALEKRFLQSMLEEAA